MSHSKTEIQQIILAGAERLLARADNSRSLGIEPIARRVQSTVEKYVLKNEPEPDSSVLHSFIDSLHADDLCLASNQRSESRRCNTKRPCEKRQSAISPPWKRLHAIPTISGTLVVRHCRSVRSELTALKRGSSQQF